MFVLIFLNSLEGTLLMAELWPTSQYIVDPSISDRMFVHQVVIAALLNHESNCQGSINPLVRGGFTDPLVGCPDPLVGCPKDLVKEFVIHFCRKPGLDLRYFGLIISSWLEIA